MFVHVQPGVLQICARRVGVHVHWCVMVCVCVCVCACVCVCVQCAFSFLSFLPSALHVSSFVMSSFLHKDLHVSSCGVVGRHAV